MMAGEMRRGSRINPDRRFIRLYTLLLISFLSLLVVPRRDAGAAGPHRTVDLIADQPTVRQASPFWVGLHFQIEEGWHIYWINPGDSGEPPRVKWSLPPGFQAGLLEWPVPRRIEDHSLIAYGYQNEVLLPVKITPPVRMDGGTEVHLNATVNWLVCREICVPGRADVALTLPIRTGTSGPPSSTHSVFAKARADLPRPAPKFWKVTASLDQHRFVLNIITGKREAAATFFPLEPNQIENAAAQWASPLARGIRIELKKSDQLLKAPMQLRGVLGFASSQGYLIDAPVIASK